MLEKNNRKVIKDVSVLPATGETRFIYHNTTNGYNYLWNEVEGIFIKVEQATANGAAIRSSATSVTTLSTDYTIVMTAATTVVTLETPSSTTNRRILNIKNGSTGNITITGNIDGTTQTLTLTQKESRTFHSNGSTWWII
jgi:hypothetical protein